MAISGLSPAIKASPEPNGISHVVNGRYTSAIQKLLILFVSDFPEQAAELVRVGQSPVNNCMVHELLSLVEEFDSSEQLFKALDAATILAPDSRQSGNTVLHRATRYGTSPGPAGERALRIVQSLVENCPHALKELNTDKLSPYQTRVKHYRAESTGSKDNVKLVEDGDEVALFLKDHYIRYPLDEVTRILYGGARGMFLLVHLELYLC